MSPTFYQSCRDLRYISRKAMISDIRLWHSRTRVYTRPHGAQYDTTSTRRRVCVLLNREKPTAAFRLSRVGARSAMLSGVVGRQRDARLEKLNCHVLAVFRQLFLRSSIKAFSQSLDLIRLARRHALRLTRRGIEEPCYLAVHGLKR